MKKILIGIPNKGSLDPDFVYNLLNISKPENYKVEFSFISNYSVDQARNILAKTVYCDENIEYLLFLDDDILIPENGLIKLLESNEKITTGIYRFKERIGEENEPVIFFMNNYDKKRYGRFSVSEFNELKSKNRYIRIEGLGLGCALIHRSVFDIIPYPYFSYHQGDMNVPGLGEDLFFARLVYFYLPNPIILADTEVDCKHIMKHKVYI